MKLSSDVVIVVIVLCEFHVIEGGVRRAARRSVLQTFQDEWRHNLDIPADREMYNIGNLVPVSSANRQFLKALSDTYSEMPKVIRGRTTTMFKTVLPHTDSQRSSDDITLKFTSGEQEDYNLFTKAELVLKRHEQANSTGSQRVVLHVCFRLGHCHDYNAHRKSTASHVAGWDVYDVTDLMHLWRTVQAEETGGASTGMSIRVVTEDHTRSHTQNHAHNHAHQHHTTGPIYTAEDSSLYFYLVTPDADILHTMLASKTSGRTTVSHHRKRRSIQYGTGSDCGLRSWTLPLSSIHFNNTIMSPDNIKANYCSGSCSSYLARLVSMQDRGETSTHHTYLKYIYRSMHPDHRDLPRACCVPTEFKPMSIIVRHKNPTVIELKIIDRMVATGCGCL